MFHQLAYIPFLEPLDLSDGALLFLLIPLVVIITTVYKAIKLEDLSQLPRQALWLSLQIVVFMILMAAVLWLLSELT